MATVFQAEPHPKPPKRPSLPVELTVDDVRQHRSNALTKSNHLIKTASMFAKIYLVLVALLYLGLALWCSLRPETTSQKVGFQLTGGSGQSEFLTIYGGLEFGLVLVLLASLFKPDTVSYGLIACVLIHASLVAFRTIGFFCFRGLDPITYKLAIGEWVIMLIGMAILFARTKNS